MLDKWQRRLGLAVLLAFVAINMVFVAYNLVDKAMHGG